MAKMFQVYGIGQALIPVLPPPIPFENAPTSSQTNYEVGQMVYTPGPNATAFYIYAGAGTWVKLTDSDGPVESVTGTANQILASPTSGDVVLSLIGPYTPATYTAHGVLIGEGSSSIVATAAGTAGQVLTSGGASADPTWTTATYPATVTAGALLAGTASNVIGSIADVATGQVLMSGGVGVIPAYSGSPSVSGTVTAGTGLVATTGGVTATAGDITATAGNVIINGAAKQLRVHGGAVTDFIGSATLVNGTVTVSNTNIAATDQIYITRTNKNASTALGVFTYSISAATSFAITALNPADGTTQTNDVSSVSYFIVRQV